jgi:hypothetical protein
MITNYIPSSRLIQPGVCTSTTRPASPYEGQAIYETDTDKMYIWNGSAWRYLATPQTTEIGAYTAFTPVWTSLTAGNGTSNFRYCQINKLVHFYGQFTLGSTSAVTGAIGISLPVNSKIINTFTFVSVAFEDPGAGLYPGMGYLDATDRIRLTTIAANQTYAIDGGLSSTVPFTWATGDKINLNMTYEAA